MICPHCGARMADGTPTCPVCRSDMGVTNKIPSTRGTWCPSCGALIPEGSALCPKCGLPSPEAPTVRPVRDIKLPKVSDADSTSEFSAITLPEPDPEDAVYEARSALPPERPSVEDRTLGYDRMAHVRVMIIAAIAALVVMGGSIIYITHPFDPGKYDQRAREQADTSTAGSPGQIEALSGQDIRETTPAYDAGEASFELIHQTYLDLGDLADRLDEQEAYFLATYLDDDDEEARQQGLDAAEDLAIDISNAIDSASQLGSGSVYADDIDHIVQLGNWLRNRVDVLVEAWEIDLAYMAPSQVQDIIDSTYYSDKDSDGVSAYKGYFDENYPQWEPSKR